MDKQIASIQKNVFTLCDYTRTVHVKEWKSLVQESKQIVEVVRNLSDQIKYLNEADLYEMPNFEDMQLFIRSTILDLIQDELLKLKEFLDQFSKSNQEVKNKLSTLFKSTLDLDWNENNVLINGTARQPALSLILTRGMKYWKFFDDICSNIKLTMKCFHPGDETRMQNFFNCYNLNDQQVPRYISLIQNVDNEIPRSKFLVKK